MEKLLLLIAMASLSLLSKRTSQLLSLRRIMSKCIDQYLASVSQMDVYTNASHTIGSYSVAA